MRNLFALSFLMLIYTSKANVDVRYIEYLISTKCVNCHKDNQRLPFALAKAADYNRNKKLIAEVVSNNYMPMWKADASYSHFDNETTLTETEKKSILEWCASSINIKKIKDIPSTVRFNKPDFSVALKDSFVIPPTGRDVSAVIKIPFEFKEEQTIRGIEFLCKHALLVHHVGIFILREPEGVDVTKGQDRYVFPEDNSTPSPNFNLYNMMSVTPAGEPFFWNYLVYKTHWQFGMSSYVLPEGCGFTLPKRGVIMIDNIHYKGSVEDLKDMFIINFIKQSDTTPRQCISTSLGNGLISKVEPPLNIEPERIQTHYSEVKLPEDMSLMEVTPHMHQLGKRFISFAVTPTGDTINIVKINDWDPDWQETYRFNPLLKIPKGATIYVEGIFDNTSSNIRNPNNPPVRVKQSMNKRDEMLEMLITFFPYKAGDESKIVNYKP